MRIGILYAGPFGEQMIDHLSLSGLGENIVAVYELAPGKIPGGARPGDIWESPEEFLPGDLPDARCDLLLVLGVQGALGGPGDHLRHRRPGHGAGCAEVH